LTDPSKKLRDIWPWIPAFRVVAETEHLPSAAQRLHVSPSALSRTVKLEVNAAGQRLLQAIRRTMTSLEHSMQHVLDRDFTGEYRVSSLGVLTDYFVLPALLELKNEKPGVIPCLTTLQSRDANRQLMSGQIEVAFYYDATTMPGITCRRIGSLTNGLYCGQGHPLFGKKSVSLTDIVEHDFSVASIGDRGTPMDGWPVEVPRRVGFQIMMLSTNQRVALSGRFVCVLPDVVAHTEWKAGRLFRFDPSPVPETAVYAACREEDSASSFTSEAIGRVERRILDAPQPRKKAGPAKRARS
jgi:DNA-binding transcriptional LysR family regulator